MKFLLIFIIGILLQTVNISSFLINFNRHKFVEQDEPVILQDNNDNENENDFFHLFFDNPTEQPEGNEVQTPVENPPEAILMENTLKELLPEDMHNLETIESLLKKKDQLFLYLFEYILKQMSRMETQLTLMHLKENETEPENEKNQMRLMLTEMRKLKEAQEHQMKYLEIVQHDMHNNINNIQEKLNELSNPMHPLKNKLQSLIEKLKKIEMKLSEKYYDLLYMDQY